MEAWEYTMEKFNTVFDYDFFFFQKEWMRKNYWNV